MLMRVPSWSGTRDRRGGFPGLFLARLERLVDLHSEPDLPFNAERLLHRAISVTYVDCRDLGLEQPANALVARLHRQRASAT